MRGSSVDGSPVGEQLRDAYRLHTLQAAVHERELADVVRALEAAGIEALIVKGWAAARLYAEPGLRPYGDIDVCVGSAQHSAAREALAGSLPSVDVDLHCGLAVNSRMIADLPSFETAWGRASRACLEDTEIRLLAPEDHLALLCVHLLTHGAWRPLWLCDVAAVLESLSDEFDWDRCLGGSRRLATWVGSTVALAERLLRAQPKHAPPTRHRPPRWLEPAVLRQWGSPPVHYPGNLIALSTSAYFRPSRAVRTIRAHWVDPVTASMLPGSSFNGLPRLPFQLRFVAWKAARFLRRSRATSIGEQA
jgi:hypothetical protein